MFLERVGKCFFTYMRPWIFFSLITAPILGATIYLCFKQVQLEQLNTSFIATAPKGKSTIEKKLRKERFLQRYVEADPYFINQKIETVCFLNNEKKLLEQLLSHPAIGNKKKLQERLNWICSEKNHLSFSEGNIRSSKTIKETDEKQKHPVQVNEKDLEDLLSLIEDLTPSPLNSPQLIIRDFHIKKVNTPITGELFELEMDLLKREWHR